MRDFKKWLAELKVGIADFGYYVNFQKVYGNKEKYKVELNALNAIIGSKNIEQDFKAVIAKCPSVIECIPQLLAVREQEINICYNSILHTFKFRKPYDVDDCIFFMRHTGLFDLIQNHIINNLYDYVTGVEVGLDSNGRKNRGGTLMENMVEKFIEKAGFAYHKQMSISEIAEKYKINLSPLANKATKKFDFVIKGDTTVYAIETNFYGGHGSGSKLNETARSYEHIAKQSKNISGFCFMWITDGTAWLNARNNLEDVFDTTEYLFNLSELENGILTKVIK